MRWRLGVDTAGVADAAAGAARAAGAGAAGAERGARGGSALKGRFFAALRGGDASCAMLLTAFCAGAFFGAFCGDLRCAAAAAATEAVGRAGVGAGARGRCGVPLRSSELSRTRDTISGSVN